MMKIFFIAVVFFFSFSCFAQHPIIKLENDIEELKKKADEPVPKSYKQMPVLAGIYFSVLMEESPVPLPTDYFRGNVKEDVMISKLPNGRYGYFAGIFKFYEAASAYRRDMLEIGYRNAIITAYRDGNRMLLDEAIDEIETSYTKPASKPVFITPPDTMKVLTVKTDTSIVIFSEKKTAVATVIKKVPAKPQAKPIANAAPLEFRIQLLASRQPIPATHSIYKNFSNITYEKSADGYWRYYTGSYPSLESAINARKKVMDKGAKEALVVAFCDKKKISLAEAQKILAAGK